MKVLFLSLWYPNAQNPVSGTFVYEQAEALRALGVEVRIMQPLPRTPFPINLLKPAYRSLSAIGAVETSAGQPVYHPRYLALPAHKLFEHVGDWMFSAIRKQLVALRREWRFDVIHAHATYPCGFAANRCRDELFPDVKVVHTIHRTCIIDAPRYNKACFARVRDSLEGADFNIFVSGEGLGLGLEYTGGRIAPRSRYISNGVNPERFSLKPADLERVEAHKRQHPSTFNLVFVAYLKEVKGVKELLEAVRNLVHQGRTQLRLFLVGGNQLGSYVTDYMAEHRLQDHVVLVGAVPHDQVKVWMRFADAFILPSHSEGTPTVLYESLFVGAPGIFTRVGGVGDVVVDDETALVIPPRSVPEIERAVARLMDDPALCQRLSKAGHALIRDRFTWAINAEAVLELYREQLRMPPARAAGAPISNRPTTG